MKVPGLDIEFELELSHVRTVGSVSLTGGGAVTTSIPADAKTKLYADADGQFVAVARIVNAEQKLASYTLIPFSNVAFMTPLVKKPEAAKK